MSSFIVFYEFGHLSTSTFCHLWCFLTSPLTSIWISDSILFLVLARVWHIIWLEFKWLASIICRYVCSFVALMGHNAPEPLHISLIEVQCDQIISQYLAIYINKSVPNCIKIFRSSLKLLSTVTKTLKNFPKLVKMVKLWRNFAKSGHTGHYYLPSS